MYLSVHGLLRTTLQTVVPQHRLNKISLTLKVRSPNYLGILYSFLWGGNSSDLFWTVTQGEMCYSYLESCIWQ